MKKLSLCCGLCLALSMLCGADPAKPAKARPAKSNPSAPAGKANPAGAEAEKSATAQADEDAIRQSAVDFVEAFNRGDAAAVAALWIEDGEYVDEDGRRFQGRAAIEREYATAFAEHSGAKINVEIDTIKRLSADTMIEDGRASVESDAGGPPGSSRYTAVHVKQDGQWRMASVRDTAVPVASHYANLQDLDWMVGHWTAEEHGATLDVHCRWIANKNFIERSYTVTRPGEPAQSGLEVIGWNPLNARIQSWTFTSDGGHAIGAWSPAANGWDIDNEGVTADGTLTRAVNIVDRLDDQAMVWSSIHRKLGEKSIPDRGEVVLKRAAR
jgi:uncharacterized protein (TIGR02246 family)